MFAGGMGGAGGKTLIAPIGTKIQTGCCDPRDPRPIIQAGGLTMFPSALQTAQRINERSLNEIEINDFCLKGAHCCLVCPYIGWVLCLPCCCKVYCCDYASRNKKFANIVCEEMSRQSMDGPRLEFGYTTVAAMQMGTPPKIITMADEYNPPACQTAGSMQMAGLFIDSSQLAASMPQMQGMMGNQQAMMMSGQQQLQMQQMQMQIR